MTINEGKTETLEGAIARIDTLLENAEGEVLEAVVTGYGSYDGTPPEIRLLDDGRAAELLKPITYHQESGREWPVPAGAWCDGASIPRVFWTLIGGPFEDKYRNASIVHDHYCITKDRVWGDVHRMFYDAMRCSGVGKAKAGVMFYAVYRFGPRWPDPSGDTVESVTFALNAADEDPEALVQDTRSIITDNLGPDAIEALAQARNQRLSATVNR